MKILHICMSQYSDGWSYQENLLAKYHLQAGHEVYLLTSEYCFCEGALVRDEKTSFQDVNGVFVTRLTRYPTPIARKLPRYRGFYQKIKEIAPDLIFSHGCQYRDLGAVVRYVKGHPETRLILDNHADFSNSARGFLSKYILHGLIWRHYAKRAERVAEIFYGVLPARVDFLQKVYAIRAEKTDLLCMGADDELAQKALNGAKNGLLRAELGFSAEDFLLVTGGKIDPAKRQTLTLMRLVAELPDPRVKLLVFGSVDPTLKEEFDRLCNDRVRYIGWVSPDETYRYFALADLAVFPGRHSVLWEQVAGMGIPLLVKHWEGTTHVDVCGNADFLQDDAPATLLAALQGSIEHHEKMKQAAAQAAKAFSYRHIAARSLSGEKAGK